MAMQSLAPSVETLLEVGLMALYLPLMPALTSVLVSVADCGFSMVVMWAYFLYALYYAVGVDLLFGFLHVWAATIGGLSTFMLCNFGPVGVQARLMPGVRDLEMLIRSA